MERDDRQAQDTGWQQSISADADNTIPIPQNEFDSAEYEQAIEDSKYDNSADLIGDESDVLRWQANEYIDHSRTPAWYIGVAVIAVLMMVISALLIRSVTFTILVPVMTAALLIYARRPPALISYTLSRKGLYINDHLHPYADFRAFSIVSHSGRHWVNLIPRHRFKVAQTVYFPEEVGEPLVDMLAARMPMQEARADIFDQITSRLRM